MGDGRWETRPEVVILLTTTAHCSLSHCLFCYCLMAHIIPNSYKYVREGVRVREKGKRVVLKNESVVGRG